MPTCMPYDIEHLAQQQSDAAMPMPDAGTQHTTQNASAHSTRTRRLPVGCRHCRAFAVYGG
jgi:hypothetical protein